MPGSVNENTICKHHDRCATVEIKNYLSKNSGVTSNSKKQIKVHEVGTDEFAMGVTTQWEQAATVWEVMDAGFNFMAVEHMVRSYSYTGLAMIRCLHECRYRGCTVQCSLVRCTAKSVHCTPVKCLADSVLCMLVEMYSLVCKLLVSLGVNLSLFSVC